VPSLSERALAIAEAIDRYVDEHPNAADTPEGVRSWWIAHHPQGASFEDVQKALDFLVSQGRLSRVTLVDGTTVYTRGALRTTHQVSRQTGPIKSARDDLARAVILAALRVDHGC
jgi:Fe2+ or Zn2+ uptake regulation protein